MAKIANLQEVTVSELKPYAKNAKMHGREQLDKLKDSIQAFGFLTPCLIDRENNLIAGHGRVMAAKELGIEKVPCVLIDDLTEEERRAYILADNRLSELGEWDMEIVFEELRNLDELNFDILLTGFELPDLEDPIDYADDDFSEDVETRCKPGDIWKLGNHRLMCGDSTSIDDVEKLMGGGESRPASDGSSLQRGLHRKNKRCLKNPERQHGR